MEKVRMGIIGCGAISGLNVLGYRAHPRAEIIAVCDLARARAEQCARQWGASYVYRDYHELLANKAVDAVDIITPHDLHAEIAIQAAQAGKHISVQKPMALNLEECQRMIAAAERAGVKLKIFEYSVFYPPVVRARELMESGEIGEPGMIIIRSGHCRARNDQGVPAEAWQWRTDLSKAGGGMIFDDIHHKFSVAQFLLGAVEEVSAFVGNLGTICEAPSTIMWRHKSSANGPAPGGMLAITASGELVLQSENYACDERFEIVGSKGIIFINQMTSRLQTMAPLVLHRGSKIIHYEDLAAGWEEGFKKAGMDFIDSLLADRPSRLTGPAAMEVIRMALATYRSHKERRPIRLAEV